MIKDLNIGGGGSNPSNFTQLGKLTFFIAFDSKHGYELWVTDGTESGTEMVKDINPGMADGCRYNNSVSSKLSTIVPLGKNVYFFANDVEHGFELWCSDGTENGTHMVKDIMSGQISASIEPTLVRAGNYLYFAANDGALGNELWRSNGTDTGTLLVKDLNPGYKSSNPQCFFVDSNMAYFAASDGSAGYGLWKTDGSDLGTVYIKNVLPTPTAFDSVPYIKYKGQIYFNGYDLDNGAELWKTDGTTSGTIIIKDINTDKEGSTPCLFTLFKDEIIFVAKTSKCGYELWQTDGTVTGTSMLKDIYPGKQGSNPQSLTVLNDKLYFIANDSIHGPNLWVTDLSDTGTHLLLNDSNPVPLTFNQASQNLFLSRNRLYFNASTGTSGFELWTTDGTSAGTRMLRDLCPGMCSSNPVNFYSSDTTILFSASDDEHGRELWKSVADSTLLQEINEPGRRDVRIDPLRKELMVLSRTGNDIAYIKVFDLGGHELLTQDIKKPIPISIDSFEGGIYYIRAYDKFDRMIAFTRFVKEW